MEQAITPQVVAQNEWLMKVKVTEQGVVIPKEFLEGAQFVEIRKENNLIVVITTVKR